MNAQSFATALTTEEAARFASSIEEVSIRVNQAENVFALLAQVQQSGHYDGHFGLADTAALASKALAALGDRELQDLVTLANRLRQPVSPASEASAK